mgnify:CR=1 FL=1
MGALVDYLDLTQRGKLPLLRAPVREASGGTVQIDAATRRNLELTQALSGGKEGSLLDALDRTVTAAAPRSLEVRLRTPSRGLGGNAGWVEGLPWLGEGRVRDDVGGAVRGASGCDRVTDARRRGRAGEWVRAARGAGAL